MMNRVTWYANRLRCMTAAEIAFRVRNALRIRVLSVWHAHPTAAPSPDNSQTGVCWFAGAHRDVPALCKAADQIVAGNFRVLSMGPTQLGLPPDWLRDPKTGIRSPAHFGLRMDLTDQKMVGDIKYLWEPSRHCDLVVLAQAWRATGGPTYLDAAASLLGSWIEQNPHPLGPHWSSSLEAGIRLINWSLAWHLLKAGESESALRRQHPELHRRWLDSVYWHLHFIRHHLSAHSSANNHLIGELAGLFVGMSTWPRWNSANRHLADVRQRLEREALLQNTSDGVNREQASSYQQFVLDFLLLAGLCARAQGNDFDQSYWQRLEAMCGFIASLMDAGGHVPQIGDADDGLACGVFLNGVDNFSSLLATGAVLFGRCDLAATARSVDAKTTFLLGATASERFDSLATNREPPALPTIFSQGGYAILGRAPGESGEIRVVFDVGPLGYLSIAAHGHADALSILLSVAGEPVLVDPGTYSYHGPESWRMHFRSTAAHNTLEIGGRSQSESGGRFMWTRHADARCLRYEIEGTRQIAVGEHSGYAVRGQQIVHRRELEFDATSGELVVTDRLEGTGKHDICLRWQLADGIHVDWRAPHVGLLGRQARVDVELPVRLDHALVHAREGAPTGWVSPQYERLVCASVIESRARAVVLPAHWVTRLRCGQASFQPLNESGTQ